MNTTIFPNELVSVIIPCYNSAKYLRECVESILNQTYTNLEVLITDDCSTDIDTKKILRELEHSDKRVKVFYLDRNSGPAAARNNSIEHAKGRYIAFCDSDDKWFENKLSEQIAFMKKKKTALCSSSYLLIDENTKIIGIVKSPKLIRYSTYQLDNRIGCLTAIYDTKLLGKKYYMPLIAKRHDWGLFLNILSNCKISYAITEPLAYYRKRKNSISHNKLLLISYNISIYNKILRYSILKSYIYFIFLFIPLYILKNLKIKLDSFFYKII